MSARLAASLCSGIGDSAASAEFDGLHFAYRPLRPNPGLTRSWRPALLPGDRVAAFHGYFDNAREIAAQLDADATDLARLYGMAVLQWGDDADQRILGEYCAIIVEPNSRTLRLSRSPFRAPPLHYYHDAHLAAASSVPRALFTAGVVQRLNEVRVADSALINFSDAESTWFEGINRVPVGSVVELQRGLPRKIRVYYDLNALPDVRMDSDADYIARANELLDEGVRACQAGFKTPGVALSGGLDSPQVAVRTLNALPDGQRLPTFTFHPEKGYDGRVDRGMSGDERAFVEAFTMMHPRLEPHFTANEGYGHDHRWNEFFHLMGGAPSHLCNMYVYHGLFAAARDRGCDLLLLAEWGNCTFSDKGDWGFVEYFLKGRWRQLWLALSRHPHDDRSILRRFVAKSLVPLLPNSLWKPLMRLWHPKERLLIDMASPLSRQYRAASGTDRRMKKAGLVLERYQPRDRRHAQRLYFQNCESETAEVYQAFEQMYGVPQRDPMAYRPFVEFCYGLPVELFMRDGTMRWLAKEMARGLMPEEQRINWLNGRWDSDWHLRIGRRRTEYLDELDRIAKDERLAAMLDIPRLRAALENFPAQTELDKQKYFDVELAVPRGLLTARFINYVEGSNQV